MDRGFKEFKVVYKEMDELYYTSEFTAHLIFKNKWVHFMKKDASGVIVLDAKTLRELADLLESKAAAVLYGVTSEPTSKI